MKLGITHMMNKWQGYLPGSISSTSLMYGSHFGVVKNLCSCGPYGTKQWQLMNGGLTLGWHLSQNNVFFCLPYMNKFQGLHSSQDGVEIMHEVCRVRIGNYDSFNWMQTLFGKTICHNLDQVPLIILFVSQVSQGSRALTLHIPPMPMVSSQYRGPFSSYVDDKPSYPCIHDSPLSRQPMIRCALPFMEVQSLVDHHVAGATL